MTTSHAQTGTGATPLASGKRHLRLAALGEVAHTEAGRFTVPLDLCEGAAEPSRLPLLLTADEAVTLHDQLNRLLTGKPGGGPR